MTAPTAIFPSYAFDGSVISLSLADLSGLTAAEADAATGDGRKVAFELVRQIQARIAAANPAPVGVTATKNTPTGLTATTVRQGYNFNFDLDISASDVVNAS
ncbi:MAG: hypothetical protein MH825_13160 [Cyanobacteria bacterium]|nr:hypothetical protein [Cyanobacteriota bacterium]